MESSNYDPMMMWNIGCQMVALNYQTPDRQMQLHEGRFLMNGRCGYVLKPDILRNKDFNPYDKRSLREMEPLTLSVTIIGARHLVKSGRGIASPFVEIEIVGIDDDITKNKTTTISDNGLNPIWKDQNNLVFDLLCPELALIHFVVYDEDTFGEPNFLGQATFPVCGLKSGYRSVPLKNGHSEDLDMAALLVYIEKRNPRESEDSEIYSCLQDLRERKDHLSAQIEQFERRGESERAKRLQEELERTEKDILEKNEERRQKK
ncbi:hypothetical protein FSP39_013958 [Pinctada imbricata]|uniref:Phosphoinositide phospholipase C n=1 Tax=Pinctada imbricata TaxID=66713 RepID=A0AA89BXC8_PINIB|nr:hypothetical protein FSP39_013958 [Pinctada imbricata]